jgi:hypothetical protein
MKQQPIEELRHIKAMMAERRQEIAQRLSRDEATLHRFDTMLQELERTIGKPTRITFR